jgi:hypothetical protein
LHRHIALYLFDVCHDILSLLVFAELHCTGIFNLVFLYRLLDLLQKIVEVVELDLKFLDIFRLGHFDLLHEAFQSSDIANHIDLELLQVQRAAMA